MQWNNLEDFKYFDFLIYPILFFIGFVAILALAYYIASQIFKQDKVSFSRLAATIALVSTPLIIASFVASIISRFNLVIGGLLSFLIVLYSSPIFYEGINHEIGLTGNQKIYLNAIAGVIFFISCLIVVRLIFKDIDLIIEPITDLMSSSLFNGSPAGHNTPSLFNSLDF
ncbi:MAG: YIP1 family protein [Candidatus Saccharibacteria bacterium]|nr:YIP1 family protein [Candidatus Saccharibacteria bacterium]